MAEGAPGPSPWLLEYLNVPDARLLYTNTVRGLVFQVKGNVASGTNKIRVPEAAMSAYKEIVAHCKAEYRPEEGGTPALPALAARLDSLIGRVAVRLGPGGLDRVHDMTLAEFAAELREGPSLRKVGNIWQVRYQGEAGDYPVKGHTALGLLARLLARPDRLLTVAELRGDPEGTLAADARLRGERETDPEGIAFIRRRLADIEETRAATGGNERLDSEEADLLARLEDAQGGRQVTTALARAHHAIASRLRTLLRDTLDTDMPKLAGHLRASLKLEKPHVSYFPPPGTAPWQF
jgi:hypothetical protein